MNRALRRLVHDEEEAQREKRVRLQQILKKRNAEAAAAAAGVLSATSTPAPTEAPPVATENGIEANAVETEGDGEDQYMSDGEEEVIQQQKLLASSTAHWKCLEDSQQAVCVAMNRRQTLFAVGEKEGRVSIWDNMTIRVITRELDPTAIVLPEDSEPAQPTQLQDAAEPSTKKQKRTDTEETKEHDEKATVDDESGDTGEDVEMETIEEGASVEGDDEDAGSAEDNASVDENEDDEGDASDTERDTNPPSTEPTVVPQEQESATHLSIEELRIVKTSLKHVMCCVWSCDSRLIFAGCEEKSNRRGRLCVWDAESAYLLATFSFDAAINAVSAHPSDPDVVIVCWYNSLPVRLNVRTREMTQLALPLENSTLTVTLPPNSRHPSLVVCARYGNSGRFIYCATSKSTVSVLDATTLECVETKLLPILIQFVDLAINPNETAIAFTSSKGIHEYSLRRDGSLEETRMYATGAVRAPWALCCFSSDDGYVVGMPIVRHRHVGESGLYTWNRETGRVQHNLGVKDGVNSIGWDRRRDAVVVASCIGALYVLEEEFKTEWPGTMYPAGFRLLTDNEIDTEPLERELQESDPSVEKKEEELVEVPVDVFTVVTEEDDFEQYLPAVKNELTWLPSIAIVQHHKRHHHQDFHIERHFGLGQSVFEPLKSAIKKPSSSSKKKKKSSSTPVDGEANGTDPAQPSRSSKSKSKSKSSSSKKRRR
ncbi:hypothetical protein Poli38472_001335 [Pythium oligandrum]|uniref:Uncharacterized protein n=1 Tax=Pythium oligandrum TaxID=41045 RepID=A0A8K1FQ93_PYTOL|nr:hypothetical protein Poli38472_001335 [Pythium oligandrum]|eukprot:TMW69179.1 hypothetical protein Poli38472_001335 [Pythium oligandrum]